MIRDFIRDHRDRRQLRNIEPYLGLFRDVKPGPGRIVVNPLRTIYPVYVRVFTAPYDHERSGDFR